MINITVIVTVVEFAVDSMIRQVAVTLGSIACAVTFSVVLTEAVTHSHAGLLAVCVIAITLGWFVLSRAVAHRVEGDGIKGTVGVRNFSGYAIVLCAFCVLAAALVETLLAL